MHCGKLLLIAVCFIAGCATEPALMTGEQSRKAEQEYRACLFSAMDKLVKLPVSADDIAAAAEGECRPLYLSYADALRTEFAAATTIAGKQYANDKANAMLRTLQTETRRIITDRVGLQSLTGKPETEQ